MAAYMSRAVSYAGAGDGPGVVGNANGKTQASSPLQVFVTAKRRINDVFLEIEQYVLDAVAFVHGRVETTPEVIGQKECEQVEAYVNKVRGIRDVLTRDHMKVAFFGRTSNGKSTVINAMLRDKILPSGIGHTTNCFLQVEGSETGDSFLMTDDSEERQNVQNVSQLAHALCKEKLDESRKVRIFWPKDKCPLLRDDVVFVDSPGIDVSENLDTWIDTHCLDADVFVLVANAESTLNLSEKNFFHKVSLRLSKPNIFILNNRWDASAAEPEYMDERTTEHIAQVRAQHQERTVDFLSKELKVCSVAEAADRIFFVSAKEALLSRLQEQRGQTGHLQGAPEGFPARYFEFQQFERRFEECISKSAVKTKFNQHSQRGKSIAGDLRTLMDAALERALALRKERGVALAEVHERLNKTEQQLLLVTQEMKDKIRQMVEDVEQRVSKALSEEIRRLSVLVDEFPLPFHSEPLVLSVFKKQLHGHVEQGLGSNLRARLSTALAMNIDSAQREMTERMSQLLPMEGTSASTTAVLPRREPFEVLYRLNCDNLCADFAEDLQFRFSWGPSAILARFGGKARGLGSFADSLLSPSEETAVSPVATAGNGRANGNGLGDDWGFLSKVAVASVGSQGTMGGLLVAGFMLKTVGWRFILATGAIYGSLYVYERLTWTNKARERIFKRQYVDHATRKLRLIVDLTSANCSHQVQQELSGTFARLCHLVDNAATEMDAEARRLDARLRELDDAAAAAKTLRNRANYLSSELALFDDDYLKAYR